MKRFALAAVVAVLLGSQADAQIVYGAPAYYPGQGVLVADGFYHSAFSSPNFSMGYPVAPIGGSVLTGSYYAPSTYVPTTAYYAPRPYPTLYAPGVATYAAPAVATYATPGVALYARPGILGRRLVVR